MFSHIVATFAVAIAAAPFACVATDEAEVKGRRRFLGKASKSGGGEPTCIANWSSCVQGGVPCCGSPTYVCFFGTCDNS